MFQSVNKEKIDLINEDIKFIKTSYNSIFLKQNFSKSIIFYILIFIALCSFLLAFLYKRKYINLDLFFSNNILNDSLYQLKNAHNLLTQKKYQQFQLELLNHSH